MDVTPVLLPPRERGVYRDDCEAGRAGALMVLTFQFDEATQG
jgi:hypothetical protein